MSTVTNVTTEGALGAAIDQADAATSGAFVIDLANDIGETFTLDAVNLHAGVTLTIDGQGHTLDGANTYRGFFAYAGALTIQNLAIARTVARGGNGGSSSAGGGAGLGGGLFVTGTNPGLASGAAVTLNSVSFAGDGAAGGNAGSTDLTQFYGAGGGGGGLGGDGGTIGYPAGGGAAGVVIGGGGGGISADGSTGPGAAGIVPGAAGGGAGTVVSGSTNTQQPGGANGGAGGGGGGAVGSASAGTFFGGGGGGVGGGSANLVRSAFGGFGGGGGGGLGTDLGGDGGFGGGGGSEGGHGGFGGGGADFSDGGFGGGTGVSPVFNASNNAVVYEGGGGLGAGGAIFVQQGGSLSIDGGNLALNTVTAGAGGTAPGFPTPGRNQGSAFGAGIFLQGNQVLAFNEAAGDGTTITDTVTDQTGSGGGGSYAGSGSVTLSGPGFLKLAGNDSYTGGTTINSGTLFLPGVASAGAGAITFANQGPSAIVVSLVPSQPGGPLLRNAVLGFTSGDVIDIQSIPYSQNATVTQGGNALYVSSGGQSGLFFMPDVVSGASYVFSPSQYGGIEITPSNNVTTEAELNSDIASVDGATSGNFLIRLASDISETFTLDAVNLHAGVTLTIDGQGHALDGANTYRGFFAYAGALTIEDLVVRNTVARGGPGGYPAGGGGAGLGGGLFVAGANAGLSSGAAVTLNKVSFIGDSAAGGFGGGSFGADTGDVGGNADYAGGGGLGGAGGAAGEAGGGGGGIGGNGGGSGRNTIAGLPGIVAGAGSAGAGGSFTLIGTNPSTLAGGTGGAAGGGGGGGLTTFYVPGGGGGVGGQSPATTYAFDPSAGVGGNGGFGGGGGGGAAGGNGGFGGGGGSGGGNGGFGGGGGSNSGASGIGMGGFGGGNGGILAAFAYEGGGGLGAGGAIFVQQGGSLTITGGDLIGNDVAGGPGGRVLDFTPLPSTNGSAFGGAIFLQGNQVLAFNEAAGTGTTITDTITDQTGSGGTGGNAGSGGIALSGPGFLKLAGNDSYTGGTTINSGTLSLPGFTSAGTGAVTFANQGPSAILIDSVPSQPGGALLPNAVLGFRPGDMIDELSFAYTPDASAVLSGQSLLVSSGGRSGTINLPDAVAGTSYQVSPGAAYGIAITVSNTVVATEAALSAAIDAADTAASGAFTISLAKDIAETFTLDAVNLHAGVSLTIDGQGHTLDGAGAYRGFFAYAGALTIQNLQINHTLARGGGGAFPAGGAGAGLGGGLFVTGSNAGLASGAAVTLNNVSFVADSAAGGFAAASDPGRGFSGGGGGLGGNGGYGISDMIGGGGGGIGADGSNSGGAGAAGIVPGAAGGGASVAPYGSIVNGVTTFAQIPGGANGGAGGSAGVYPVGGGGGGVGGGTAQSINGNGNYGGANGGFGGGGGGGDFDSAGGNGGFGGGGGSSGGNGGFGGGAGGGGKGGFGAGNGANLSPNIAAGGGGLGAGGAIFVQQGGSLSITGGNLLQNGVIAGMGGSYAGYPTPSQDQGSAFGGAIFLQGNQVLAFNEAAGTGTTITDTITDQTGSGGTGGNAGSGGIALSGPGFLKLAGNDSYTGGTTINSGTLSLPGFTSAGTGAVTFANQGPSAILIDAVSSQPGGALLPNAVLGFSTQDVIDILSLSYSANASATLSGTTLLVASGGRTGTITLPDAIPGATFQVGQSQYGGVEISVLPHST